MSPVRCDTIAPPDFMISFSSYVFILVPDLQKYMQKDPIEKCFIF